MSENKKFTDADIEYHIWKKCKDYLPSILPMKMKALSTHILVVATWSTDGWRAYCNTVPGKDHATECLTVYRNGTKIEESIARAIFPFYQYIPYAR